MSLGCHNIVLVTCFFVLPLARLVSSYVTALYCQCYASGDGKILQAYKQQYVSQPKDCHNGHCVTSTGTGCLKAFGDSVEFNGAVAFCFARPADARSLAKDTGLPEIQDCSKIDSNEPGICYCDSEDYCNGPLLSSAPANQNQGHRGPNSSSTRVSQDLSKFVILLSLILYYYCFLI